MFIFINGLLLGLSLIMSLGPQNLFLIKQGARKNHAALSAFICFCCDFILIGGSIIGLDALFDAFPGLRIWMLWSGSAFLLYFAIQTFLSAFSGKKDKEPDALQPLSRIQIILFALGFSLLNPYAILDTMIIIGSGSSQFPEHQMVFLSGVIAASFIWFSSLTFTSWHFAHIISKTRVWQSLEFMSGSMMTYIGIKLALSGI